MGLSSVTGTSIQTGFKWLVGNNLTGSAYNQIQNSGSISKQYEFGTAAANAASGGGDEVFSFQQAIAGAAAATIDLNAMTNLLNIASVSIVRIKGYQIRLLSAADDSTIVTPVSSAVYVNNIAPATPSQLDFGGGVNAGTGLTLTLTVVATIITAVAIGAAGTGYPPSTCFIVCPVQAGGSGAIVGVVTNGSGVPTSVVFMAGCGGTGYTAATVPSVLAGGYVINSGGAHCYFDVLAGGFLTVSATQKNITIRNMHPTATATIELDVLAATS